MSSPRYDVKLHAHQPRLANQRMASFGSAQSVPVNCIRKPNPSLRHAKDVQGKLCNKKLIWSLRFRL